MNSVDPVLEPYGICDTGGSESQNGNVNISYNCAAFRFDEGTCTSCGADETIDCTGQCSPAWWLGDAVCDNGVGYYKGHYVNFDCAEFDFDRNTCVN